MPNYQTTSTDIVETGLGQCTGTLSVKTNGPDFLSITLPAQNWLKNVTAEAGLLTIFIRHTSASLTIQENADPNVLLDLKDVLSGIAPENFPYRHDSEGPDDMPAHVKAMLTSTMLNIPVRDGLLQLGTWQGIYLIEHRSKPHDRQLDLHFLGKFS